MNSLKLREAIRSKYAWPGGYAMFVGMCDGEVMCMDCARKEYRLIAAANRARNRTDSWMPEYVGVNWEDDSLFCAHCNEQIESAYGA